MLHNVDFNLSGLCSGVVVERLVVVSADSEHILRCIDFVAEIHVVNLVDIALVHVVLQHQIQNGFRRINAQLCKHSQELHFRDMAVLGHVEILELRLQINSTITNCRSVLF